MRYVSVGDLQSKSEDEWRRLAGEEDVVVTSAGLPIAILTPVTEATLEESLTAVRRARAVAAVHDMQRRSVEQELDRLTPEEIDAEISAVRKDRKERLHKPE